MPFAHLPQTEDTQYDRLVKVCADYWRGDDFHLHLFDAASGALLGGLGLHRKAHHAHAMEIGYWIRSDRAGQGLCTHAAQMAVALAVHRFDCVRVQCVYDPSNAASARVAEKVGFQVECDLPGFLPTGTDAMRAEGWRVSGTARMTALSADRARAQPWWDDLVARLQWWDGQGRPVVDCA
ncbi:MAG: GNAT family N-acetyltransferase [Acidimicrobiales bacterium]|nr:GNAT family N-acetyltransferase [Acidimicrobiales bacterium]